MSVLALSSIEKPEVVSYPSATLLFNCGVPPQTAPITQSSCDKVAPVFKQPLETPPVAPVVERIGLRDLSSCALRSVAVSF